MKRSSLLLAISLFSIGALADDVSETDKLSGEGTIESPYIIEDAFDLHILRQRMENREFFTKGSITFSQETFHSTEGGD